MDRIESVGGPGDHRGGPDPAPPPTTLSTDNGLLTPTTPQQQRSQPQRPQSRSRRPSVRIQRLPSASSLSSTSDHPNQQQQQLQQRQSQASALDDAAALSSRSRISTNIDEDEVWQGNRRRSSSEPRPGRWSSPPPIAVQRTTTPMLPLTEEISHHSRGPTQNKPTDQSYLDPNHGEATEMPPQRPPTGRLRRTSHAALHRLTRNRASTVAGPVPRITDNRDQRQDNYRADEYDPEFVNMLDVIGM